MEPCGILGCSNVAERHIPVYGHLPDGLAWAADELPVEFRLAVCAPHHSAVVAAAAPVSVTVDL